MLTGYLLAPALDRQAVLGVERDLLAFPNKEIPELLE